MKLALRAKQRSKIGAHTALCVTERQKPSGAFQLPFKTEEYNSANKLVIFVSCSSLKTLLTAMKVAWWSLRHFSTFKAIYSVLKVHNDCSQSLLLW